VSQATERARKSAGAGDASPEVRVALIGPSFFSYVQAIAAAFRERGVPVAVFDEKHSNRPFAKLLYRLGLQRHRWSPSARHLDTIHAELRTGRATDVFLINSEAANRAFVERLKAEGMRVHLYMWDGVANKPGFVALLDTVDSRASFDPRDCERFGMDYIPLFAEPLFEQAGRAAGGPSEYDISFCGTVHSSRTAIVARLIEAARNRAARVGLMLYYHSRALLYAKGIVQSAVWRIAPAVSFQSFAKTDIARMFAASRMVLDVPHPGQTGLTARTFEVLAAGVRLLTTNARACELLPRSFADRIVAVGGIDQALSLDFEALGPLPMLTAEQRYYLSLDRFVDALIAMAGIATVPKSVEPVAAAGVDGLPDLPGSRQSGQLAN
jgi:hypothetical protein